MDYVSNIKLNYAYCRSLINDADVLLFQPSGIIGSLISRYTNSPYSHAALAYWNAGRLYALEFREFKGSRQYLLSSYIEEGDKIDVFRPVKRFDMPYLTKDESFNKPCVLYKQMDFTPSVAHSITKTALDLIGIKYSWWNIVKMAGTYIPFIRLHRFHKTDDHYFKTHSFVCSTLVTFSYRKNFIDPVPFLADRYTTPGDLARSAMFYKLFEILS